jgi:hypothetical protein
LSAQGRKTLEEVFDTRSKAEHVHNALDLFDGSTEEEKIQSLFRRARQADVLARFAYRTALSRDELLSVFRTDTATAAFWSKDEKARLRMWGARLNLDKIQ